jgi:uncharacterized protein (TIGR02265 family)
VPEKLVFEHTVDSLLRTLERPAPPAQIAALDALGIDLSKPLLPAYSVDTYAKLIDFIIQQRFPNLPPDEAHFELGRAFLQAYTQTLLGRALKGLMRTLGPRRALDRTSRNFRTANNYTDTRLRQLGPTRYELWFNFALRPGYYRGIVYATLELSGAKQPAVQPQASSESEGVTFLVTWQP